MKTFEKIQNIILALAAILTTQKQVMADSRLIARLTPAPAKALLLASKEFKDKEKKEVPKLPTRKLGGLLTFYGGYYDYSNKDGSINYPLRHEAKKIYVVVTPRIEVAKLHKETVSHIKADGEKMPNLKNTKISIPKDKKSKIYLLEKVKNDEDLWTWKVSEKQLPENRRLSRISLIIISETENIFVPTGSFLSQESEHLILPQIHVLGRKKTDSHILENIDSTKYFEPIKKTTEKGTPLPKKPTKKFSRGIVTNF
ncbi:hypothetical protein ACFLY6_01170 [Candidatus Dependentiae bacterium]